MFLQSAEGDAQTLTEVDLFISTQRIKVLNADSQVRTNKQLLAAVRIKAVYSDRLLIRRALRHRNH